MIGHFKLIILAIIFLGGILWVFVLVDSFARAERIVPSITAITVNTLEDELNSDGDCSLREAITAANTNAATDACPPGNTVVTDTINFAVSNTILISTTLEVTSGGPLAIDGRGAITVSGGGNVRIFDVKSGSNLSLDSLQIVSGSADKGGGIYNSGNMVLSNSTLSDNIALGSKAGGGGIFNLGILTVRDSVLFSNTAYHDGGGIYNNGEITITNSTLSGNNVNDDGGGIYNNSGKISLTNGTLAGNHALYGGGIYNRPNGAVTIINSTMSGNSAGYEGGGLYNQGSLIVSNSTLSSNSAGSFGGGIRSTGLGLTLHSTILANNSSATDGPDCSVLTATTEGYNLVGDKRGCDFIPTTGDLTNIDAKLGPLGDNGGPTQTHALLPGSLAIDRGNLDGCTDHLGNPLTSDQRGFPRSGRCDIGAYEWQSVRPGLSLLYLPTLLRSCPTKLFFDDFSNPGSGWATYDDPDARFEYINDEYRILVKNPQLLVGTSPGFKASDYIAEVDVRNSTGVYGTYGIIFGISDDWNEFYTFEINPNGGYAIWRTEQTNWIQLAAGFSKNIHPGTSTNQLKVERTGTQIWAYNNGELLNIINDGNYTGLRSIGLIATSFTQPNVDVRFDNFSLYPGTCGESSAYLSTEDELLKVESIKFDPMNKWEGYYTHSLNR